MPLTKKNATQSLEGKFIKNIPRVVSVYTNEYNEAKLIYLKEDVAKCNIHLETLVFSTTNKWNGKH